MRKRSWWTPLWNYARRLVRQHRDILRSLSFIRILTWSGVGSVVICGLLKARYPELDLDEFRNMPVAVAGLFVDQFVVLGVKLIFLPVLVPPAITVSGKEIRYSHGESGWVAKREDRTAFKLVVFSPSVRRLIFRYKGKRRSFGLAESVDLDELRSLLPDRVTMVDSRDRFAFFHEGRLTARR